MGFLVAVTVQIRLAFLTASSAVFETFIAIELASDNSFASMLAFAKDLLHIYTELIGLASFIAKK